MILSRLNRVDEGELIKSIQEMDCVQFRGKRSKTIMFMSEALQSFINGIRQLGWKPKDEETTLTEAIKYPFVLSRRDAAELAEFFEMITPFLMKADPKPAKFGLIRLKELVKVLKDGPVVAEYAKSAPTKDIQELIRKHPELLE